ncbi:hypothetical protein SAMN05518672_11396 [Chitinophaga sp. CF118]|nr:hypothetical protein SAMN05518672_11396 [Chitinophaga sp. CF118]
MQKTHIVFRCFFVTVYSLSNIKIERTSFFKAGDNILLEIAKINEARSVPLN